MEIKLIEPGRELTQWDTDRYIELDESVDEVHFANIYYDKALVIEPQNNLAPIPNILLQYHAEISVYLVVHTDNGKRTIYHSKLGVRKRTKPSDYVYTETEVRSYEALESRVQYLEENQVSDDKVKDAVESYLDKNPVKVNVDDALSEISENPVQNKVVAKAIKDVEEKIPTDYVSNEALEKKGYLTEHQDISNFVLKSEIPTTPEEVGAEEKGTAESKVNTHNVDATAHSDIRELLKQTVEVVTKLLDCDDETLDQTSEIVAYVKSNKALIDAITTSKVSVDDIVNDLVTNLSNKPLSAAQGVVLKEMIDSIRKALNDMTALPNPYKLTFAGAVSAEYDGSGAVTVTIPDGKVERIEKDSTDTEVTLEPNKLYIFPEMESLSITLAENLNTAIVNEFHLVFKSGETATTLELSDEIKLPDSFTIDASKIYEISIMENCLTYQSWEAS